MLMTAYPSLLGRHDRRVNCARLRIVEGAPRHRLTSLIEEGLRLSALPGESEGRLYCFRRLRVEGPPEQAARGIWLDAFQSTLLDLARRAVHGVDPAAAAADAVYFLSLHEAYEHLLSSMLRRRPADAWYWPAITGAAVNAGPTVRITQMVEQLSSTPASWTAVASVVFGAIEPEHPVALLRRLPEATVRQWLEALGDNAPSRAARVPPQLAQPLARTVARAAHALGSADARVEWLTSLAIALAYPAEIGQRGVLRRAREYLQRLATAEGADAADAPPSRADPEVASPGGPARPPDDENAPGEAERTIECPSSARLDADHVAEDLSRLPRTSTEVTEAEETSLGSRRDAERAQLRVQRFAREPTGGAGLYFLLNVLRDLKREEDELTPVKVARFFQLAATHAGLEDGDPILRWAVNTLDESAADEMHERLPRVWLLEVRRWCWRRARISARAVVRRPGYVSLTRTDLDVFLSLDLADVRIRRAGLDLDPGWLPWFGRVVRFHYLYAGELRA
jgi:hypothetical protein